MTFFYRAVEISGDHRSGRVEASTEQDVARLLRERGMLPLEIRKEKQEKPFAGITRYFSLVRFSEIVEFTRQLSIMINAV